MSGTGTSKRQTSLQPQETPIITPHILCPTLKLVHVRQCTNWAQTWSNLTMWVGAPSSGGEHTKAFRTDGSSMHDRSVVRCCVSFLPKLWLKTRTEPGFYGQTKNPDSYLMLPEEAPLPTEPPYSPVTFGFWDRFSLCSPDWTETHYVARAGLRLTM